MLILLVPGSCRLKSKPKKKKNLEGDQRRVAIMFYSTISLLNISKFVTLSVLGWSLGGEPNPSVAARRQCHTNPRWGVCAGWLQSYLNWWQHAEGKVNHHKHTKCDRVQIWLKIPPAADSTRWRWNKRETFGEELSSVPIELLEEGLRWILIASRPSGAALLSSSKRRS